MKKLMVCVIALAMMFGIAVRAQVAGGDSGGGASAQEIPKMPFEILSDTMGVDFTPYMRRIHNDLQRTWDQQIPAKAKAPELKKGITGIRLTILPDGRIGSMKLEKPSGDLDLDKAAWYAITGEGQFPALPKAFHGPLLELRVGFFYNMPTAPDVSGNKH